MLKVAYKRSSEPVRKPTKKQLHDQQVKDLAEQFSNDHYERELEKELNKRGLSRAQYEIMKAQVEGNLNRHY